MAYSDTNITNEDIEIIFTNLVDTDMLYGHRNDAVGYGRAIEEVDTYLEKILELLTENDLLFVTADHGCDPTVKGTDHTREKVPVLIYRKGSEGGSIGEVLGFDYIANTITEYLL